MVANIKLLGKHVRYRTNVLYHLLKKIGNEPNADLFQFVKGASHQRTEEEIKFVFEHLGWSYSLIKLVLSQFARILNIILGNRREITHVLCKV